MKLVFFGNPKFASDSLEYLLKSKYKIDLVVTNPDKRKGRGLNHQPTAVKIVAQKFKCELYETDNFDNSLTNGATNLAGNKFDCVFSLISSGKRVLVAAMN